MIQMGLQWDNPSTVFESRKKSKCTLHNLTSIWGFFRIRTEKCHFLIYGVDLSRFDIETESAQLTNQPPPVHSAIAALARAEVPPERHISTMTVHDVFYSFANMNQCTYMKPLYNDTNMSLFQESSNIVTSQQQSLLKGLAVILSQEPKDTHPPGLLQQLCRSSLQCLHRAPRCARTTLEQGSLNFLLLEACRHSYSIAAPLSLLSLQHIAPSCVLPRMRAPHKNH